jgi:hypothetical protein
MARAKSAWRAQCKSQASATAAKIEAAADLQAAVQALGTADLTAHLMQLQKKAEEARKK